MEERKNLTNAWVAEGKKNGLYVIVHVGADSLVEARELARHSQEAGADGISAMSPVFFRPSSVAVLVESMKFVAAVNSFSIHREHQIYHFYITTSQE